MKTHILTVTIGNLETTYPVIVAVVYIKNYPAIPFRGGGCRANWFAMFLNRFCEPIEVEVFGRAFTYCQNIIVKARVCIYLYF